MIVAPPEGYGERDYRREAPAKATVAATAFTLPWPPSVNHDYRRVGVKTLISAGGRKFRKDVRLHLFAARVPCHGGDLELIIDLYPPDNRRRDVDNCLKSLLDALQHGLAYHDDYQVKRIVVTMREPASPAGLVKVAVVAWEGNDA
jgi:crossover junction endodeoxyribonuclease RusA